MAKVYLQGIPIELTGGQVHCGDLRLKQELEQLFARTPVSNDLDNQRALLLVRLLGADLDVLDIPPSHEDLLLY